MGLGGGADTTFISKVDFHGIISYFPLHTDIPILHMFIDKEQCQCLVFKDSQKQTIDVDQIVKPLTSIPNLHPPAPSPNNVTSK